jgi:hypothetical protein
VISAPLFVPLTVCASTKALYCQVTCCSKLFNDLSIPHDVKSKMPSGVEMTNIHFHSTLFRNDDSTFSGLLVALLHHKCFYVPFLALR